MAYHLVIAIITHWYENLKTTYLLMHEFITFQIGMYHSIPRQFEGKVWNISLHSPHEDTKISSLHVFREIIEMLYISWINHKWIIFLKYLQLFSFLMNFVKWLIHKNFHFFFFFKTLIFYKMMNVVGRQLHKCTFAHKFLFD